MKTNGLSMALLSGFLCASLCFSATAKEAAFRVATFNIRTPIDKAPNAWTCRVDRVRALIQRHGFDIMGLQEATAGQIDDLLTEDWAYVGVGRVDGKRQGETSCIFYKKTRFDVQESGTFWLSETPEEPGSKSWETAYARICTWARFTDRKTGKTFVHFNTHLDHISKMAREKGMELILKRMKTIAPSVPVVLTGDMNATSDSKPIKLATSVLWDTAAISKSPHAGPLSTYNGFNVKKVPEVCIDYLFVSKGITVLAHATLDDSENGLYPSDHFPVVADLLLD